MHDKLVVTGEQKKGSGGTGGIGDQETQTGRCKESGLVVTGEQKKKGSGDTGGIGDQETQTGRCK